MPIFEFKCEQCGKKTELFLTHQITYNLIKCSFCGGDAKKIISLTSSPRFTGTGFYKTDYGIKNEKI